MSVRKTCPKCGSTSTENQWSQQYWGVKSKEDGKLICKECAIEEVYNRMFDKQLMVDE